MRRPTPIVVDLIVTATRHWWHARSCQHCRRLEFHDLPVATATFQRSRTDAPYVAAA
jgi:hypothetical protein